MSENKPNFPLSYKGRPLVRSGDEIYYGDPKGSHVVFMQILAHENQNGVEVPTRVNVQLLSNAPGLTARARIVKQSDKSGLFSALDIGGVWLTRALAEKK